MHIIHHLKKEELGLARATLELAVYEERLGHTVCCKQPSDDGTGQMIYGLDRDVDIHSVHSQFPINYYFDDKPNSCGCMGNRSAVSAMELV